MKNKKIIILLFCWLYPGWLFSQPSKNIRAVKVPMMSLDVNECNRVMAMLDEVPEGLGRKYKERAFWESFNRSFSERMISNANSVLKNGFPRWNDEAYLAFFTKGDSESGKKVLSQRLWALEVLAWAECFQNQGKYVKSINNALIELADQKSWVNSNFDQQKLNFDQKNFEVDLSAAEYANNIAQALYILDDKVSEYTKRKILNALDKKVFDPVLKSIAKQDGYNTWLTKTNNGNPVCLSGVVGAALTVIKDRNKRAQFVVIAARYSENYLNGFLDDGYCTEGISYYNYGMGHYILLREEIWIATKGEIDLFSPAKLRHIVKFLPGMNIINEVYPAIADCKPGTKPSSFILTYFNNLYTNSLKNPYSLNDNQSTNLVQNFIELGHAPLNKFNINLNIDREGKPEYRSCFTGGGVSILRKGGVNGKMGVAIKGGNNNEHHNHNDLGSYTLVIGKEMLVEDPGATPYDASTFNDKRYKIKTIASYGHSAPLVAGKQQVTGLSAQAVVTDTVFTDREDRISMNLKSAYSNVKDLKILERAFRFNRNTSEFTVTDTFGFSTRQNFETAIITRGKWQRIKDNQLSVTRGSEKVLLTILSSYKINISSEEINEGYGSYTRLKIFFPEPVVSGNIKMIYTPL